MGDLDVNQSKIKEIEDCLKGTMPGNQIERIEHEEFERLKKEKLVVFRIFQKNTSDILVGFTYDYFDETTDQQRLLKELTECLKEVSDHDRVQIITVYQNNIEGPCFWPRYRLSKS